MSTTRYQSITEALTQIKANQLNEDGHTDVPSSIRMCKTIMEDAHDILCALCNTDMDEEIDTWWTNKLAVSASTLNKLRDYYVHEVDDQEQPDEADMEIEEAKISVAGAGGASWGRPYRRPPQRGTQPAVYSTDPGGLSNVNPFRGFPTRRAAVQGTAIPVGAVGGVGVAAGTLSLRNRNVPQDGRRRPGIQEEDLDENIDMEAITSQYGKYAIPAGAAALGFTLAGEKSKRPTFKGFLKNALVAGAAGIGAEVLKRQYTARNPLAPNASSPFLQKATNPFRKV